jgi:hypothetical protein
MVPGGQSKHSEPSLKVPAGHSSQAVFWSLGSKPEPQELHSVAPGPEMVPAAQGRQPLPLSKVPAGHSTQAVCCWLAVNPGPQEVQEVCPMAGWIVPEGHGKQLVLLLAG